MIIYKSRTNTEREKHMWRDERLIGLYKRVYSRAGLVRALKIGGAVSTFAVVAAFAYALGVLLFAGEYISAVKLAVFSAVPFFAVTLMRMLIDCERPYEVFVIDELAELKEKRKKGQSFPSRHVFSAFVIGTLWFSYNPIFGISILACGVILALARVLLGIHFIKDVVVGAVIGILSGVVGMLIW